MRELLVAAIAAANLIVPVPPTGPQCFGVDPINGQPGGIICIGEHTPHSTFCHWEPTQNVWIFEHKAKAERGDLVPTSSACPAS